MNCCGCQGSTSASRRLQLLVPKAFCHFLFFGRQRRGVSLETPPLLPLWPALLPGQPKQSRTALGRGGGGPSCLLSPLLFLTSCFGFTDSPSKCPLGLHEAPGCGMKTCLVLEDVVPDLALDLALSDFRHFCKVTGMKTVLCWQREGHTPMGQSSTEKHGTRVKIRLHGSHVYCWLLLLLLLGAAPGFFPSRW